MKTILKKVLVLFFSYVVVNIVLVSSINAFEANLGVSLSSDISCATNYTRGGLNCYETGHMGAQISVTTSCTTVNLNTTWGIPSTAKLINVPIEASLVSGTAAGAQFSQMQFFTDSNCSNYLPGTTSSLALTLGAVQYDTNPNSSLIRIPIYLPLYINGQTTIYAKKWATLQTGAGSGWILREPIYYLELP